MRLLVMTAVFIFAQVRSHGAEGAIAKIKYLLSRSKDPQAWHSFEGPDGDKKQRYVRFGKTEASKPAAGAVV